MNSLLTTPDIFLCPGGTWFAGAQDWSANLDGRLQSSRQLSDRIITEEARFLHELGKYGITSDDYAKELIAGNELLAYVSPSSGDLRFPAFQFDGQRRHYMGVAINQLLLDRFDGNGWGVTGWWVVPNTQLDSLAPKSMLIDPNDHPKLTQVAMQLLESES